MPDFRTNLLEITRATPSGVAAPGTAGDTGFGVDTLLQPYIKHSDGTSEYLSLLDNTLDASMDNLIHNSSLDIWPEGTSFAAIANGTYSVEGWQFSNTSAAVVTITRDTDVPTISGGHDGAARINYSLKVDVTTADAAVAAGDLVTLNHYVEGHTFNAIAGRKAVMSFWFKTDRTGGGIFSICFRNSGADRTFVHEFTVSAGAWTKIEVPIAASPSGGTWDYTNGTGLRIQIVLMAGSNFTTSTLDSWQSTGSLASSNQTNGMDSTSNNFWICQPKLELGDQATIFVPEPISINLARCHRYFYKSYEEGVNPGTNGALSLLAAEGVSAALAVCLFRYPTPMRAAPTTVLYPYDGSPTAKVSDFTTTLDVGTTVTVISGGLSGFHAITDSGAGFVAGTKYIFHMTASARL